MSRCSVILNISIRERRFVKFLPLFLSMALVGCGGGSGGSATLPSIPTMELFDAAPAPSEMFSASSTVIDVAQWRNGVTPYASGFEQGTLSRTQPVIAAFLAYDPSTKLLTPTAASDIDSFLKGYKAGSGGAAPTRIFILQDLLWDGNSAPTSQELLAMSNAARQLMDTWSGIYWANFPTPSPSTGAITWTPVISVKPGMLVNPASQGLAASFVGTGIMMLLDTDLPENLTSVDYNWLYAIPEAAISSDANCKGQILSGMVDLDVTTCATKATQLGYPAASFGLIYPAWLNGGSLASIATQKTLLYKTWGNLHAVETSLKSMGLLSGLMVFGFYLDPANPTWSGMIDGKSFMNTTDIADLQAFLSM